MHPIVLGDFDFHGLDRGSNGIVPRLILAVGRSIFIDLQGKILLSVHNNRQFLRGRSKVPLDLGMG